ncbi:MAG TPA: DUF1810 domain-containing protein [Rhizomicrobium sp.]|nr:DUF1810 domain-containing protein [Rhizomicrobium sp.]
MRLDRFIEAQAPVYAQALAELRAGRKASHWMWFIFPQVAGLGESAMSRAYAIQSLAEARAYLAHPVLGARLRECCQAVMNLRGQSAHDIFGSIDEMKFRSCLTLFAEADHDEVLFFNLLETYFDGDADEATLELLAHEE